MSDWPFPDGPETTVLTLRSIREGQPVLVVERDEQGYWYFLNGSQSANFRDLVLVPLGRIVELHPAIQELANLATGWRAERETPEAAWEPEHARTRVASRARFKRLVEEHQKLLDAEAARAKPQPKTRRKKGNVA